MLEVDGISGLVLSNVVEGILLLVRFYGRTIDRLGEELCHVQIGRLGTLDGLRERVLAELSVRAAQ